MPTPLTYPGVYVEEIPSGVRAITGVATSIAAFLGRAPRGPVNDPTSVYSYGEYERVFGGLNADSAMSFAVRDFFLNGGSQALVVRVVNGASATQFSLKSGASSITLEGANPGAWADPLGIVVDYKTRDKTNTALFNLTVVSANGVPLERHLNVSASSADPRYITTVLARDSALLRVRQGTSPAARPDETALDTTTGKSIPSLKSTAGDNGNAIDKTGLLDGANKNGLYALDRADIFNLLCIPPYKADGTVDDEVLTSAATYCEMRRAFLIVDSPVSWSTKKAVTDAGGAVAINSRNAAVFFPRLRAPNPLRGGSVDDFPACGAVAGVIARTDAQRGVWKAPAGLDATLNGVQELSVALNDAENGELNTLGVNCLRAMPGAGRVVWGARTLQGNDRLASEWKYVPVRRLALHVEESLYRGLQWVVFEPNDEALWSQIRLNAGSFMQQLFRQGAFAGTSPRQAYFVKCDRETTTAADANLGIVNILVGFAPLKPAEFVVLQLQQMAGQIGA